MKKTKVIVFFLAMLVSAIASAQSFPSIETEDLKGDKLQVPADLGGKKSIVFLAFTPEAEQMLDNWYAPVYTLFLDKNGFNAMAYDCHVKLVMMFTGASQAAAESVMEKIRKNVDEDLNNYLLFYQGEFKEQMQSLGLKKKDDAYVFVLDEKGKVILQETGTYSESKLEKIASLVEL